MKIHIEKNDAEVTAPHDADHIARGLHSKAQAFISALELETELRVSQTEQRNLEVALLRDFLEVHNAAIKNPVRIPESKAEVDRLTGARK